MRVYKRLFCICCALLFLFASAPAGGEEAPQPELTEAGIELGGSAVRYPRVTGLPEETAEAVNALLAERLQAERWLNRVPLLMSSPVKLETAYTAFLREGVLSAALLARGDLGQGRAASEYHTANIDLTSGALIALDGLFSDAERAREILEEQALEAQAAASPMLAYSDFLPLPEEWSLSETGLTFYYGDRQVSTLRDGCGTLAVPWAALAEALDLAEGSVPLRAGADRTLYLTPDSAALIRQSVSEGALPGIPAALGDDVAALAETWGEAQDPDLYENGRLLQPEGDAFRGCYLLTDALGEGWEGSVVQGIRSDRLPLWGLIPGVTTRDEWRAYLGEPETAVAIDEDRAASWRIEPGESDYYPMEGHTLRLHADGEGVLRSIFLME